MTFRIDIRELSSDKNRLRPDEVERLPGKPISLI